MDIKTIRGKCVDTFKEETRKSLKEIDGRANKLLHEMGEKTDQK